MDSNQNNFTPVQAPPPPTPATPSPGLPSVPSFPSQPAQAAGSDNVVHSKSEKGMRVLLALLIVIGLGALGVIGYALWYNYSGQAAANNIVMPTLAPTPRVTAIPTISEDDSTATTEKELNDTTIPDNSTDSATIDKDINGIQ